MLSKLNRTVIETVLLSYDNINTQNARLKGMIRKLTQFYTEKHEKCGNQTNVRHQSQL